MTESNFETALVHESCIACGAKCNKSIVMNRTLTKKHADAVKEMHGKATNFTVCGECKAVMDAGGVFLVEIDPSKTPIGKDGIVRPEDAYRTGRIAAIKEEAYDRIFDIPHKNQIAFIDPEVSNKLGLFEEN